MGRGGEDRRNFSCSTRTRNHGALAFFAAVLNFLCHDRVVSRTLSNKTDDLPLQSAQPAFRS